MKFKVGDLRVAVKAAEEAHRARFDEAEQKRRDEYETARAAWVAEHAEKWRQACDSIRAALRRKEPITRRMLPHDGDERWNSNLIVFAKGEPPNATYTGPGRELERVKVALELIADDEVSTTALQQLGVSPAVLRDFLDLVPAGGAE